VTIEFIVIVWQVHWLPGL